MTGNQNPGAPIVFISSTIEDLHEYREAAAEAARAAGFLAVLSEDWAAKDHPPLDECLKKVGRAHLTIAIVANRYGWVPKGQPNSITALECQKAEAKGQKLLPFILDPNSSWPKEKNEHYRLAQASENWSQAFENEEPEEEKAKKIAKKIAELSQVVTRNVANLKGFKEWLSDGRITKTFSENLDRFRADVKDSLRDWLDAHPKYNRGAAVQRESYANPRKYLQDLHKSTGHIDIRGLAVGMSKAHRFPIKKLYIQLESNFSQEPDKVGSRPSVGTLAGALPCKRLVIIGDPGSGKTTFLRWVAHILAGNWLGLTEEPTEKNFGLKPESNYLPILVSIAEWLYYMEKTRIKGDGPTQDKDPQWLTHYLEYLSQSLEQSLDASWFQMQLKQGNTLLLLDGLDEVANHRRRELAVEIIENILIAWPQSHLVVTSRPVAYSGRSLLPGFHTASIKPLSNVSVGRFLTLWSQALFPGDAGAAEDHRRELTQALSPPSIRVLTRNTVMLTALAVVHWNEKHLPEQRAKLYGSILNWLARSREQRSYRAGPERRLEVLRVLALAMQETDEDHHIQIPHRRAAELVAHLFDGNVDLAEGFLEEEELDSGILVRRGSVVRFWLLSFQEYLTAKAIAGLGDIDQFDLLLGAKRYFFVSRWKMTVLFLGEILYEQGREKVDRLVSNVLEELFRASTLGLRTSSYTFRLLVALVRDLSPFGYRPADSRYLKLRDEVMVIFKREGVRHMTTKDRVETAEAVGQTDDPRLEDEELHWIELPAGQFLMGAEKKELSVKERESDAFDDGYPPHEVKLDGYLLGRWPVTVAEYTKFLEDNGYYESYWWEEDVFGTWEEPDKWDEQQRHPNRPVTGVSWHEACAYCKWLTGERGRTSGLPEGTEIRLPTEAEWEWAAKGNSERLYPWGNEDADSEHLNFAINFRHPTPVGIFPAGATPQGLLDLAGNVWEWCFDCGEKNYYLNCKSQGIIVNPSGPRIGETHVLRGGSWSDNEVSARTTIRFWDLPIRRLGNIGFRLCWGSPIRPIEY